MDPFSHCSSSQKEKGPIKFVPICTRLIRRKQRKREGEGGTGMQAHNQRHTASSTKHGDGGAVTEVAATETKQVAPIVMRLLIEKRLAEANATKK